MQFFTQSGAAWLFHEMALLRYPQPRDRLSDPRGALLLSVPSAEVNREVQEATRKTKKRGPYKRYSATVRAEIGKHASHHGVAVELATGITCTCQRHSQAFPTWECGYHFR